MKLDSEHIQGAIGRKLVYVAHSPFMDTHTPLAVAMPIYLFERNESVEN